jgi:hypothetical protein
VWWKHSNVSYWWLRGALLNCWLHLTHEQSLPGVIKGGTKDALKSQGVCCVPAAECPQVTLSDAPTIILCPLNSA